MQSVRLNADASKEIAEEVAKSLDVSLNHIGTYRSDGGIPLLLGQTKDYGGGELIESLAIELKNVGRISFFYCILN